MKDLLAGLLALIESKSIPAPFKLLLGAALLAILLRVAGFPIVSYVETGVRELFAKAPMFGSLVIGLFVGSLMAHPLKALVDALIKLSVLAFDLKAEHRKKLGRNLALVGWALLIALLVSAARMILFTISEL